MACWQCCRELGAATKRVECSRCGAATYCSETCQYADFFKHILVCGNLCVLDLSKAINLEDACELPAFRASRDLPKGTLIVETPFVAPLSIRIWTKDLPDFMQIVHALLACAPESFPGWVEALRPGDPRMLREIEPVFEVLVRLFPHVESVERVRTLASKIQHNHVTLGDGKARIFPALAMCPESFEDSDSNLGLTMVGAIALKNIPRGGALIVGVHTE
jgi:hypothetical protein